jgi:riboflavin biosynthesis pyrimidine reductase
LHSLRAQHDAVLVGINTIAIDKPQLNVRNPLPYIPITTPRAIVLDSQLKILTMLQDLLRLHRPIVCTCSQDTELLQTLSAKISLLGEFFPKSRVLLLLLFPNAYCTHYI